MIIDSFHNGLSADFQSRVLLFTKNKSIAMIFNKTTNC